jgi:hypothetical protein
MERRLICVVVAVSYAVSQAAAWPHAHGAQGDGHDQRPPHVHGGWLLSLFTTKDDSGRHHRHWHDHGHEHGHSHAALIPSPPADDTGSEHDDDCVYLPYVLAAVNAIRIADDAGSLGPLVAIRQEMGTSGSEAALSLPSLHASPSCPGEHCALYLTLRTLRI